MKFFNMVLVGGLATGLLLIPGSLSAQNMFIRAGQHSGYAAVGSQTMSGHVSVGLPMAERIEGASLQGWIGFYPVRVERPVSVQEEWLRRDKNAPNPATTFIVLHDVDPEASIIVLNDRGERVSVSTTTEDDRRRLDVSSLPTGTYSAIVSTGRTSHVHRFVVQR